MVRDSAAQTSDGKLMSGGPLSCALVSLRAQNLCPPSPIQNGYRVILTLCKVVGV
jgi:hypothetical protein